MSRTESWKVPLGGRMSKRAIIVTGLSITVVSLVFLVVPVTSQLFVDADCGSVINPATPAIYDNLEEKREVEIICDSARTNRIAMVGVGVLVGLSLATWGFVKRDKEPRSVAGTIATSSDRDLTATPAPNTGGVDQLIQPSSLHGARGGTYGDQRGGNTTKLNPWNIAALAIAVVLAIYAISSVSEVGGEVSRANRSFASNELIADSAPQQTVVAIWHTNDLLEAQAEAAKRILILLGGIGLVIGAAAFGRSQRPATESSLGLQTEASTPAVSFDREE